MNINRENLKHALTIVKPGLANREIIEQTSSFAFMGGRVVTYNDEISISYPIPELEGLTGAVKAEELYALLEKIKQDEISLELKNNEIILIAGKTKAGMRLQKEIVLPLDELGKAGDWNKLPADFLEGLKFTGGSCSTDRSRPILMCVNCYDSFCVGSDGYRIARYILSEELPLKQFMIPARSVSEVIKLMPTEITETDGWIHLRNDEDIILSCRTFEDTYPDVDKHLKVKGMELIFPKNLNDKLDRVGVFARREHYMDESITCELEKNRLVLSSKSENGGWIKEAANMRYKGEKIKFSITPTLLKNITNQTHKCTLGETKIRFEEENWEYIAVLRG